MSLKVSTQNKVFNSDSSRNNNINKKLMSSPARKKVWIDNSITNVDCKKLYRGLKNRINLNYRLMFSKKVVKNSQFDARVSKNLTFWSSTAPNGGKFEIIKKIYSLITTTPPAQFNKNYSRNSNIVAIEFYHLWFYKSLLRGVFNKNNSFFKTAAGYANQLWKTFRSARYDYEARKHKNLLKLNWTDALYFKTISKVGPRYLKLFKNIQFKVLRRLKKAKYYFKKSMYVLKNALRIRMLFGKNFKNKKYSTQRKNWKFSKKLSRLYYLTGKFNLLQYKFLKRGYLKHSTRYRFIAQPRRILSYFNVLTSFNNVAVSIPFTPHWINYFNLTKRRATNLFSLLKKRSWSAENNINRRTLSGSLPVNLRFIPFHSIKPKILDIFECKKENILLNEAKPIILYKKFEEEGTNFHFKSRLNNKNFIKSPHSKYAIQKLKRKLRKLKFELYKQYNFEISSFLNFTLKNIDFVKSKAPIFFSLYKYQNVMKRVFNYPAVLYTAPLHLRNLNRLNYFGVVITITQKNYFFNLVNAKTGEVKKVFSSGYSRVKTTRLRRSPIMFTKVFNLFIDYLKNKSVTKLKFVRISQPSLVPKNILFEDQKKVNWYPNQFKHAKIRVRRWIYELNRVHGAPLRGPKLRRK